MPVRVQSVERAAAILQVLSVENQPTSLAHLADTLGLAKATVHGLVQTLRDVGFVDQDPESGLYAVGGGLLQLGATALDHNELRARALNWTDALAARTGQAALLGTRDGDRVVVVHHVYRPDGSRQTPLTGTVQPLHVDALGKVLLAHDPRALRSLAGRELESHTYRTMTDPASLRRELADVRDHGWAAAVEEAEPDAVGLAAPIRDRAGFVVAAVGVVGGVDGLCDGRHRPRQALVTQVVAAGRSISREAGARPAVSTQYVAAIDQGTTSTRCLLFDREGRMVSVAQRQHRQSYPRPGWVEHDAEEIWHITRELVPQALNDAGVSPDQVAGLGVTNQRETTVVWDRATGCPVAPAIVWQDTRGAGGLAELVGHLDEEELTRRTGLPLSPYPSGPKLRWILDSDPVIRERAERGELLFGTMDTWLVWNLSGGLHVTDATNASRTLMMDLETLAWDPELLEAMRVPASMLPEIRPSIGVLGVTRDPVPGIPISAVIGDQQASLFGQTAFERGQAKCTFGTGSFLLMNTGTEVVRSRSGLITTVAHTVEGEPTTYALEGSVAQAGALVEWCRTSLDLIRTAAEIETLAASVEDNGGCYVVPAFSGLYAPYWESEAQGVVVGLTSYVTKGHIARAVLEATAWQARDVVDAMILDAQVPMTWLAVDGGMTADNLLMQTVADVLDVPVIRPMMAESVALGAAYAAGLAVGYWPDRQVLREHWHRAAEWRSRITAERRDAELAAWHHAVSLSIAWGRGPAPGDRPGSA